MATSELTTRTASCACKAFRLQVHFDASSLPISRALCLCNSCRLLSGSCEISYIILPPSQSVDLTAFSPRLNAYQTSPRVDRYFCSCCGAHALCRATETGSWFVATGLLDRTEGIVKWTGSKWVEDTLDGGISPWLTSIIEGATGIRRKLSRWMRGDGEGGEAVPEDFEENRALLLSQRGKNEKGGGAEEGEGEERLGVQCHCGGVKFDITRPNEASKKVRSPFPDLIIPYHTGASSANPENITWWLRDNDTKYLAGTCTCTSCRRTLGFEIQTWAFIPKCNLFRADGAPMDYDMGTLRRYESSPGVWREFCGCCGASVFWHCEERPELVDVSVGLLDPREGARVEAWLDWRTERVSFSEMAVSRSLVDALQDGLRSWGEQKKH